MRVHKFTFPKQLVMHYCLWRTIGAGFRQWPLMSHTRLESIIKYCESIADLSTACRVSIDVDNVNQYGVVIILFHLHD